MLLSILYGEENYNAERLSKFDKVAQLLQEEMWNRIRPSSKRRPADSDTTSNSNSLTLLRSGLLWMVTEGLQTT